MFPELSTQRFVLQQILRSDQAFIYEGLSHPQVIPYYGVWYDSFEDTAGQMDFYEAQWEQGTGCFWKITDRGTGESAGVIGFNNYQSKHNKAEIGYWLLPAFWKKGIIAEVLPVVINYMQEEKKIHRIESLVEEGNEESYKVMEKAGFEYEGTMRDCEIKRGKYISLRIYALISGKG
ncbi:MAG TPA: GNAT family protein [Chitinophagaceae bacterium]|nr:GNAT family protein [Chitinophagaceae bacterium]